MAWLVLRRPGVLRAPVSMPLVSAGCIRGPPAKCGPKVLSAEELLAEIRKLLEAQVFSSEGYRRFWTRFRQQGTRTSNDDVLGLPRQHQFLLPAWRAGTPTTHQHEGTIGTTAPNRMWGTDATQTATEQDGTVPVFAAVDHCNADCIGIHVGKRGDRVEALEPVR